MNLWKLSSREQDVLRELATDAHNAKAVAAKLGISTRTVEHHVSGAIKRMGAANQLHAVLLWDRANREAA
jgi:DNA-binding NarL/FixJ family response regulator